MYNLIFFSFSQYWFLDFIEGFILKQVTSFDSFLAFLMEVDYIVPLVKFTLCYMNLYKYLRFW